MSFVPGQLVICVESEWHPQYAGDKLPAKGIVYTVRDVSAFGEKIGLYLAEIHNPPHLYINGFLEAAWDARAFRPLDDAKLSIFRAALTDAPVEVA